MTILFFPIVVSLFSITFSYFLIRKINQSPSDSGKIAEISLAIKEGAMTYLKREYKTIAFVAIFLFFALCVFLGFRVGAGFFFGALFIFTISDILPKSPALKFIFIELRYSLLIMFLLKSMNVIFRNRRNGH
jgi:Na+/H+-translocating membrane pyrophosphatase